MGPNDAGRSAAEAGKTPPVPLEDRGQGTRIWSPGTQLPGATQPSTQNFYEFGNPQKLFRHDSQKGLNETLTPESYTRSLTSEKLAERSRQEGTTNLYPGAAPADTSAGKHDREVLRDSKDPGAKVPVHGQISAPQKDKLEGALSDLPIEARRQLGNLNVVPELATRYSPEGDESATIGRATKGGETFLKRSEVDSPDGGRGTLAHELSHQLENRTGHDADHSFGKGSPTVSDYAGTNSQENFAETGRYVLENLDRYRDGQAPATGTKSTSRNGDPDKAPSPTQAREFLELLKLDPNRYAIPR